ncbi:IDEAL domain-containing protein [Paenibacillus sp. FJAT-26967]|uniref:IDEAL domain-containing protein n=1 Tax=Paenibacillus sp. FJAT-26967 TaxID=1729690 RepID=UPI000837C8A3|nr:IDEAL domain-containing protein [Paenibacillus sp. FJAT-26967]
MGRMNVSNEALLGLVAEMIMDDAIRTYKEKNLYQQIDSALAEGDEASFLALTAELKSIQSPG